MRDHLEYDHSKNTCDRECAGFEHFETKDLIFKYMSCTKGPSKVLSWSQSKLKTWDSHQVLC
jgi:hypothetical protein